MRQRPCVELTAVFSDGTVERWEGDKADYVWSKCDWSWLDKNEKPTVTHPLRKVTQFVGVPYLYEPPITSDTPNIYADAGDFLRGSTVVGTLGDIAVQFVAGGKGLHQFLPDKDPPWDWSGDQLHGEYHFRVTIEVEKL